MKKIAAALICVSAVLFILGAFLLFIPRQQSENPAAPTLSSPSAAPEISEDPALETARGIMEKMSDEEKVWQMLMLYPEQILGCSFSSDHDIWCSSLEKIPAGGIFFASANMPSAEGLKEMLAVIKSEADIVPFLALDEEGGSVARLSYTLGKTTDFLPMYEYKEDGPLRAYANALTIALDIGSFGFNVNFAPIADVWTNPDNSVIGKRAYSDDPQEAAELVASAVEGLSKGGIISTLKHFPGHGDTLQDSHKEPAVSEKSLKELEKCEFLPFMSGIEAGAGMVMVGHITLTEIDPYMPATLSRTVITRLLREQLGFDGVVITDAFAMEALCNFDNSQAALMAIDAGCDIILCPKDPQAVVELILENVSMERIEQSVLRILMLKLEYGIIQ